MVEELRRLDDLGLVLLRKIARSENRILAGIAKDFLIELQGPDAVEEFLQFIRSLNFELETGCLLLNRTTNPNVDTAECCMRLDAIAARCRELFVLPGSAWDKCKVINRVLFHEHGYRGNTENFYDPLNSYLSQVIARKKGIPITLSIVYILVAQRCGLYLEPIDLPLRFLVGCFMEETPFYIDPFERGAFRSADDLTDFLRIHKIRPRPGYLAPAPVGEVLLRCCRNLVRQYKHNSDRARAKLFSQFVHEFEMTYRRHARP